MSRSASALIRFSPNAGSGGGESALDRLSLTLTVRLDGTTMSTTSGQRLSTELTIPFAPYSLCARARLVGIAPVGHAPLVIASAAYNDSDCWYGGPADEPLRLYSDAEAKAQAAHESKLSTLLAEYNTAMAEAEAAQLAALAAQAAGDAELAAQLFAEANQWLSDAQAAESERNDLIQEGYAVPDLDKVLRIHFPNQNLYPFFEWPTAVVTYEPPLGDDEFPPAISLELTGLKSLNPPTTQGETEQGVQLPMRLVAIRQGVTGETEIQTLNYEQAPSFTGSGTSVTVKMQIPPGETQAPDYAWEITPRELLAAVGDEPGIWDLYWRIYHGSGDMLYRAKCLSTEEETTLGEPYRDRRDAGLGGGFGTFLTTDFSAAQFRVSKEPLPWLVTPAKATLPNPLRLTSNMGERLSLGIDEIRTRTDDADVAALEAAPLTWIGPDPGNPGTNVCVSWSVDGSNLYVGGRLIASVSGIVFCACLVGPSVIADLPEEPPPGTAYLRYYYAATTGSSTITLAYKSLRHGATAVIERVDLRPFCEDRNGRTYAQPKNFSFSRDGSRVLAFTHGRQWVVSTGPLTLYSPTRYGYWRLTENSGWAWEKAIYSDDWETLLAFEYQERAEDEPTINGYPAVVRAFVGARYRENTPVVTLIEEERTGFVSGNPITVRILENDAVAFERQGPLWGSHSGGENGFLVDVPSRQIAHADPVYVLHQQEGSRVFCGKRELFFYPRESSVPEWLFSLFEGVASAFVDLYGWEKELSRRSGRVLRYWAKFPGWASPEEMAANGNTYYLADGGDHILLSTAGSSNRANLAIHVLPDWVQFKPTSGTAYDPALHELILQQSADGVFHGCFRESARVALGYLYVDWKRPISWDVTYAGDAQYAGDAYLHFTAEIIGGTVVQRTLDYGAQALTVGALSPRACLIEPPAPWPEIPSWQEPEAPTEEALFAAHNTYRASLGLSALESNESLHVAIAEHLAWLKASGTGLLSHTGSGDSTPLDRALLAGYEGSTLTNVGENLALYSTTVADVMAGWINSPGHHATLIDPKWADLGVAILPAERGYYWGALFGVRA